MPGGRAGTGATPAVGAVGAGAGAGAAPNSDPAAPAEPVFVSDFFDFSIYIDADEEDIERWYVARFLKLRDTVFRDPQSYFHRFSRLTEAEAGAAARDIWRTINGVNLRENIQPTRERARLILEKDGDHQVRRVRLRM